MARIDFYVLPEHTHQARLNFVARLCQKALNHQLNTVIWLEDHDQAASLDAQLWQNPPESFIPHALLPASHPLPPIVLCAGQATPPDRHYIINLTTKTPPNIEQFERVAEVVIQDDGILNNTRQRYREYKQAEHSLHMHNL